MEKEHSLTRGKPLRVIFRFMLPVLGCNLLQQFYSLIDAALVGHILGDTALAAVGATAFLCNLLLGFSTGLTSGFAILSARDWGVGDRRELRGTAAASFALALAASVLLTAGGVFLIGPVLRALRTPENIFLYSYRFLLVNLLGLTASLLYNLATALLRSVGKSGAPLVILACSLGINFLLALVFLRLLDWGVTGAALATVTAQALSAAASWGYLVRFVPELRFGWADLRGVGRRKAAGLLRAGLAMLLCVSIPELGSIILQAAVNAMGTAAISAYTVGRRVVNVTMAPLNAISIAMATYVSQNLGAGKKERIREGMRSANGMHLAWSAAAIAVVFCFSRLFAVLISGSADETMIGWAGEYMRITNLFYPFLGLVLLYRQVLQSLGNRLVPIACSALEVAIKAAVVFFLAQRGSFLIISLAEPSTWVVNTFILLGVYYARYHRALGGGKETPIR